MQGRQHFLSTQGKGGHKMRQVLTWILRLTVYCNREPTSTSYTPEIKAKVQDDFGNTLIYSIVYM